MEGDGRARSTCLSPSANHLMRVISRVKETLISLVVCPGSQSFRWCRVSSNTTRCTALRRCVGGGKRQGVKSGDNTCEEHVILTHNLISRETFSSQMPILYSPSSRLLPHGTLITSCIRISPLLRLTSLLPHIHSTCTAKLSRYHTVLYV